jgi:hypothetical protein
MNRVIIFAALALAACQQEKPKIDIVDTAPPPPQAARNEQVNYNGRDYKLGLTVADRVFNVRISGITRPMKSNEKKDATNIAISGVHYFGCKDKQNTQILNTPSFNGGVWSMKARCA